MKYVQDWRDGQVRNIPDLMNTSQGVASDKHEIVLFADYTDPETLKLNKRIEALRKKYPGIRYNILAFPKNPDCNEKIMDNFREAYPSGCIAARAVKAANSLGGKEAHWAMVEFLLKSGQQVTEMDIMGEAPRMGLDPDALLAAMDSPEIAALVEADIKLGNRFRVRSVPAIWVDGKQIPRYRLENEPIVERVVTLAVTGKEE